MSCDKSSSSPAIPIKVEQILDYQLQGNSIEHINNCIVQRKAVVKECNIEWPGFLSNCSKFKTQGFFRCAEGKPLERF